MSKNIFSLPTIMFTSRDIGDGNETEEPGGGSGQGTPHVPMMDYDTWFNSEYASDLYGSGGVIDFDDYRQWWHNMGFPYFAWVDMWGRDVSWTPGDPTPNP